MSDNDCSVRVAQNDFCSHIDEFIYEKQTTFEHFLVNQNASSSLSCYYQNDTQQIGSKSRPRSISNCQDRAINVVLNFVSVFVFWNIDIITSFLKSDSEFSESIRDDSQIFPTYVFNSNFTLGHSCQTNPRTDFNHIR